jgi:hypothetical protein
MVMLNVGTGCVMSVWPRISFLFFFFFFFFA